MLVWIQLAAIAADPEVPSEELLVWGDRFQRWERRWYVETEVRFGEPLLLDAWRNHQMALLAVQVRAVLDCDKDFPLGARRWEVHCDIEDLSLVAMPKVASANDSVLLREIDATLTDASVQMQVSDAGGVPNVDLERVAANDAQGRLRQERLRQLMSRVVLPFHLAIPEPIHDNKRWYENRSRLMSMPSTQGSAGGVTVAHFLDEVGPDWFVVQSIGHSTTAPVGGREAIIPAQLDLVQVIGLPTDLFELDMHGVAVVSADTGVMTERVWVVSGGMLPSSQHMHVDSRYFHSGRLRVLGDDERPDVGPTFVAARPDGRDPERAPWVALPH